MDFRTKKEAEAYAINRRKGFRRILKRTKSEQRRYFLKKAIKSIKVRRIKNTHWSNPIYIVEGR